MEQLHSDDLQLKQIKERINKCRVLIENLMIDIEKYEMAKNVNVLRAKNNSSFNCKLFISTMIFKESQLCYKAFENELNRHINKDFSILLPIDINGKPDWNYMENFIEYKYKAISQMLNGVL